MILERLKTLLKESQEETNKIYLRNLLKEVLQFYVLNFVYSTPPYHKLIFTGGTCLRLCFGLPRLSEDLDFDLEEKDFDFNLFNKKVKYYFQKKLKYQNLSLKFRKKNKILFLKFPVLADLGFAAKSESEVLFVRCDFSFNQSPHFKTITQLTSAPDFSFFVRAYDLSTLFANKIAAFLQREFKKGKGQEEPFKGRDVFDLVWFLEQSQKANWELKPNWPRLKSLIKIENKKDLPELIRKKALRIEKKALIEDLRPFFPDFRFVQEFAKNYQILLLQNLQRIL